MCCSLWHRYVRSKLADPVCNFLPDGSLNPNRGDKQSTVTLKDLQEEQG